MLPFLHLPVASGTGAPVPVSAPLQYTDLPPELRALVLEKLSDTSTHDTADTLCQLLQDWCRTYSLACTDYGIFRTLLAFFGLQLPETARVPILVFGNWKQVFGAFCTIWMKDARGSHRLLQGMFQSLGFRDRQRFRDVLRAESFSKRDFLILQYDLDREISRLSPQDLDLRSGWMLYKEKEAMLWMFKMKRPAVIPSQAVVAMLDGSLYGAAALCRVPPIGFDAAQWQHDKQRVIRLIEQGADGFMHGYPNVVNVVTYHGLSCDAYMLALLSRNDELIDLLEAASVLPTRGRLHHMIRYTPVYRDVARLDDATATETERLIQNVLDRFARIERNFDENSAAGRRSAFAQQLRHIRVVPNSGRPNPSDQIYGNLDHAYGELDATAEHHRNRNAQISARLEEGITRTGDVYTRIVAKVQEFEQEVDQWLSEGWMGE